MARYHSNEIFPIIIQWGFFAFLMPRISKCVHGSTTKLHVPYTSTYVSCQKKFDLDTLYLTLKYKGASRICIFAISPPSWKIFRWDFHTIFLGHISFICVTTVFLYLAPFDLEIKVKFTNISLFAFFCKARQNPLQLNRSV